jgi:hypothetical protein
VPATNAAPNIHFRMLTINPPSNRQLFKRRPGFAPQEVSFHLPPRLAGYVLYKHLHFKRLRTSMKNKSPQLFISFRVNSRAI